MGKMIYKELRKELKFDSSSKYYMRKPESVLENDIYKYVWDFDMKTHHLIPARRQDLVLVKKKKTDEREKKKYHCWLVETGFWRVSVHILEMFI